MRFFTKAMWCGWQESGGLSQEEDRSWSQSLEEYRQQAEHLRHRLPAKAFEFFLDAPTHDGSLRSFCVAQDEIEPWDGSSEAAYPVRVDLTMAEESGTVWRVTYRHVRRVVIDYPSNEPLFIIGGEGFGDWGYDELTDAGDGFFRHEVLFATGATLLVEFRGVEAQIAT